jgi:uncharacterized protein YacL
MLAGAALFAWFLNFGIAKWFNVYTKNNASMFDRAIADRSKNIIFFSMIGLFGYFLGSIFGSWISYIVIGLWGFLAIAGIIPFMIALFSTLVLTFSGRDNGLENSGKMSSWIYLLSMIVDNSLTLYFLYRMFLKFI